MTPETIHFGWLLLTAALLTLGPLTIWWVRREVRDEATAKEAERIISSPAPFELTEDQHIALAAHTQQRIDQLQMLVWAERLADRETVLFGVPEQRSTEWDAIRKAVGE